MQHWLPALDGVAAKLERGAHGGRCRLRVWLSTVLMAKAFPNSQFVGFDFHEGSIEQARAHAKEHGVARPHRFEVATAKDFPGTATTW